MTTATLDLTEARATQLAEASTNAQHAADALQAWSRQMEADPAGARYVPIRDDDPATWQGMTRWAALEQAYIHWLERETALRQGKGPFRCPPCGDIHETGYTARVCFDHDWDQRLYDLSLSRARILGARP